MKSLARLLDRLFWWWGFWRLRPKVYAHNSMLKQANEYARRYQVTIARFMRDAPYQREHHRDLLTGMVIALRLTKWVTEWGFGRERRYKDSRPGPHLKKAQRRVGVKIRPGDTVPENVYAVETRQCRRHGGWVLDKQEAS